MKIWLDDTRTAPIGYEWCKSVNEAIGLINQHIKGVISIELIDFDHDAGDYQSDGGDYIKVMDYMEFMGLNIPVRIHTMNPVGRNNMLVIARRNHWKIL